MHGISPRRARGFVLIASLLFPLGMAARDKSENWIEVRSPHFTVVSNASEKEARRVADQFERIRSVFHMAFPRARVDSKTSITVLATRDENTFKALVPESWLEKGQLQRTGLFLRSPEKNYVLLRLNAGGENPYHLLYHEYTHLLVNQDIQALPLWLDEGLAEFYGNSEIHEKDVWLGRPDVGHVQLLLQNKLLPLRALFVVDHSSPLYNEQNKGSMFYAESWALTHYLMMKQLQNPGNAKNEIVEFLKLTSDGVDAVTAGTRAFGDLDALEKNLEAYVRRSTLSFLKMKASTEVDEDDFSARPLPLAESAAVRGDFLIYNRRYDGAKSLLEAALRADPNSGAAHASMGFLEFQQGRRKEAEKWFSQAVELDAKSYLANYYYAALNMRGTLNADTSARVEASLRNAVKFNHSFAPAYNLLATYYLMKGEKLDEAHMLGLQAVALEPGNVNYFLTVGGILLKMGRGDDAVRVGKRALSMTKTVEESAAVGSFLSAAEQYQQYLAAQKQVQDRLSAASKAAQQEQIEPARLQAEPEPGTETRPPVLRHRDQVQRGARKTLDGTIGEVTCSAPAELQFKLVAPRQTVRLHSDDYFKVEFRASDFTPSGELHPCTDLQGSKARVFFWDVQGETYNGEIISVELRK